MHAKAITPILNISNLEASFAWFEKLGWRKCWAWTPPGAAAADFGSVGSGECEVFLCVDGQGGRGRSDLTHTRAPAGNDVSERGVWMTVWVDDVDVIHERCVTHGLEITHPPTNEPWGVREFHLRHPDGHVFRISRGLRPEERM